MPRFDPSGLGPDIQGTSSRDFKLSRFLDFSIHHFEWNVTSDIIGSVKRALLANTERLQSGLALQLVAMHFARQAERAEILAEQELYGHARQDVALSAKDQELISRTGVHFKKLQDFDIERSNSPEAEVTTAFIVHDMFNRFRMFATTDLPDVENGIESLLGSILMGSWTAFEVAASDLWELAINHHPATLASLAGNKKRISSGTKESEHGQQDRERSIALDIIGENSFDIRHKMGTILRSQFRFDRLAELRRAYSQAFSKDFNDIDAVLADKTLDVVSTLRNLLIHRAGIADEQYVSRTSYLPLPSRNIGEKIELDGEMVIRLVETMLDLADRLLLAVDEWLTAH